jgi:hypothetical protein
MQLDMQLERYEYRARENFISYVFDSVGPRGTIRKVVNYQPIVDWQVNGRTVMNLFFGDWNEEEQRIDGSMVSNNDDRDKVLATVASTILEFIQKRGRYPIHAKGASPVKTRLYQMGINANRAEIESLFLIFGYYKEEWIPFEPGRNFEAFLVIKR